MEPMLGNTCYRLTPLVSSGGCPMLLRSPMSNLTSYCIAIGFHRSTNIPGLGHSRMDQSHSRLLSSSDGKFSVSVSVSVKFKLLVSTEILVRNATENRKTKKNRYISIISVSVSVCSNYRFWFRLWLGQTEISVLSVSVQI